MLRALFASVVLMTALPAAAQPAPGGYEGGGREALRGRFQHVREVCRVDFAQYCAAAGRERGARRECIRTNRARFSQPCQDALAEMQAWRRSHPGGFGGDHDQGAPPQQ